MTTLAQIGPFLPTSAWMLLWGLAAALPLLIHLWNRRQYREVPWAAMAYLLRAMKKNARRVRIEQLLLLIIRVMIVVLAALAWMDWLLTSGPLFTSLGGTDRTHTVIVLDASYSMGYSDEEESRLDRAKQLAAELVEAGTRGDGYSLVLLSEPPQVIIGDPAFEAEDVKAEIERLPLHHVGADLPAALAQVESVLQAARKEHPRLTQQRVVLISDLQAATWGETENDDSLKIIDRLAAESQVALLDVGEGVVENSAVTSLRMLESVVTPGRDVTLAGQIKNTGEAALRTRRVEFLTDGRVVDQQTISLEPGEETSVAFSHRFDAPGEHVVQLRLADDGLLVDNHRWLSVPVRPSLEVLLIAGKPGAARFAATALSPYKTPSTIRTTIANETALLERDLSRFDCVMLCNVARIGRDEALVLRDYVAHGGGLVTFLGDQVAVDSYNRQLGKADAQTQSLLPAALGNAAPLGDYRFDPRDYRHELTRPFRTLRTGLEQAPTYKYIKLQVDPESAADVAVWFKNGDPAIVEQTVGRGRSILVATSSSTQSVDRSTTPPTPWSGPQGRTFYVPLLHRMLALAVSGRNTNRNVLAGQPISSSIHTVDPSLSVEVKPPHGAAERLSVRVAGEESLWNYAGTRTSGVYGVQVGKPVDATQLYAVNIDPAESDLSRVAATDLPASLQLEVADLTAPRQTTAALGATQPLFRWLLVGVLGLLFLESLLAWRFGNRN